MTELVPSEAARLAELEAVVTDGLQTFVTVGRALAEIRDSRLYRSTHDTFEAYCQQQWGLSRPRAYQLIEAAAITEAVSTNVDTPPPANEGQARALSGLPTDTAAEVMRKAHDATAGRVTAAAIRQVREEVAPKADPWAARIASELAASDEDYREQAATPAPVEPSPAVTAWLDDSQEVKDSGYLREFFRTLARADDFLLFNAERLGPLIDQGELESLELYAVSVGRFVETVRRSRAGLRVINGGM